MHLSLSTGRHLLDVGFITILKSNLYTVQTTVNTTENIYSHAQETTQFNPAYFNWNISDSGGIVCKLDIPQHRFEGKGCSRELTTVVTAEPTLGGVPNYAPLLRSGID